MAFIPVTGSVQVTVEGVADNQLTINDTFWQASGAVTLFGMSGLGEAISGWVGAALAPLLSRDWASTRVRVVDLGSPTGLFFETASVNTGGVDIEACPNNVAACVSIRSANRGRSGRGRNFVPGIPNSVCTLNTLDNGFISDLLNAYTQFIGAGTFIEGWEWCVLSRFNLGAPRTEGLMQPVVSVEMVTPYVRSMRSREVGHGA